MSNIPQYSVLMSVYKKERPEWLNVSIKSILCQTIKPSQFVLVQDGPIPVKLQETINKFYNENPKLFRIIKLKNNVGLGLALNAGIKECKYEYIARMDSDDYSIPTRIEKQLNIFKKHPDLSIIGSNVNEFKDDIHNTISKVILPKDHSAIRAYAKKRCPFRHPSIMYKKSAVLKAGNYRSCYLCEDYDLYTRMIQTGSKCYNIQEPLTFMRIDDNFYRRRGGFKYLKSILHFKKEQVKTGFFTKTDFIISATPHIIICLMPNILRDLIYKKFLRRGLK